MHNIYIVWHCIDVNDANCKKQIWIQARFSFQFTFPDRMSEEFLLLIPGSWSETTWIQWNFKRRLLHPLIIILAHHCWGRILLPTMIVYFDYFPPGHFNAQYNSSCFSVYDDTWIWNKRNRMKYYLLINRKYLSTVHESPFGFFLGIINIWVS